MVFLFSDDFIFFIFLVFSYFFAYLANTLIPLRAFSKTVNHSQKLLSAISPNLSHQSYQHRNSSLIGHSIKNITLNTKKNALAPATDNLILWSSKVNWKLNGKSLRKKKLYTTQYKQRLVFGSQTITEHTTRVTILHTGLYNALMKPGKISWRRAATHFNYS